MGRVLGGPGVSESYVPAVHTLTKPPALDGTTCPDCEVQTYEDGLRVGFEDVLRPTEKQTITLNP